MYYVTMSTLLELPRPSNSLTSVHVFDNTVESHSRGLSSLGKSEHTIGEIIVSVILGKLQRVIRQI